MRLLLVLASLALLQCTTSPIDPIFMDTGRMPAASVVIDASGYRFDPADRSCDGYPRLEVDTIPGTCLGMVLTQNRAIAGDKPWKMPRTLAQVPGKKEFLVTSMGGWSADHGALFLLRANANGAMENLLLKSGLNMPHEVLLAPDGFFYLGETDQISRFHVVDGKLRDWELVIGKLPRQKDHMHPLVALAFDPRNGDLYINAGSPSDHCFVKNHGSYSDCPEDTEAGLGALYRIPGDKLTHIPSGGILHYEVAAHGLRNSMALAFHSSGQLLQGENGRDFKQLEEPYEELNVIDLKEAGLGKHYGWPYCYDFHAVSPEWKFSQNGSDPLHERFTAPVNCFAQAASTAGQYQPPHILMPPHSAPLHMGYYNSEGALASLLKGKLLLSWHGHQPTGHRLVAYAVDNLGLPRVTAKTGKETFSMDVKNGCPVQKPFKPDGGLDRFATYQEIISRWDQIKGVRPKGAPVGFTIADDGSIWIAEDKNNVIVRLARFNGPSTAQCGSGNQGNSDDPRMELLAWRHFLENNPSAKAAYENVRDQVTTKYCANCHGGFAVTDITSDGYSTLDFLVKNDFFVGKNALASKLYQALARTGDVPAMPPADVVFPESQRSAVVQGVKAWIEMLPPDLEKAVKRTTLKETRKVRQQPGNEGKVCGQIGGGDVVYVDPRPESVLKKDGWSWNKAFLIPGDSHLFRDSGCVVPPDGVYYMAGEKL